MTAHLTIQLSGRPTRIAQRGNPSARPAPFGDRAQAIKRRCERPAGTDTERILPLPVGRMQNETTLLFHRPARMDNAIRCHAGVNLHLLQQRVKAELRQGLADANPECPVAIMYAHRDHRPLEPGIANPRHRQQELATKISRNIHTDTIDPAINGAKGRLDRRRALALRRGRSISRGMDRPMPALSVIVPAYGVGAMLYDALASLEAQSITDWEAIVIDDGDPSVIDHFAAFASDIRFRLLQTDNGGIAVARNRAIAAARAPLITLLDGDDRLTPDYMATMLAHMAENPRLGFITCDARYFGEGRTGRRFSEFQPQVLPITLERVLTRQFNVFICCTLRRDALASINGFDPTLRSAEDFDLWIRLLGAGWPGDCIAEPLAHYRRRAGSLSSDTIGLLTASLAVYRHAAARFADRPEGDIARRTLAETEALLLIELGIEDLRSGSIRSGLASLRQSGVHRRSRKWALAMTAIALFPPLAGPLIRFRDRA